MRLGKLALLSFALTLALPAIQSADAAQSSPQQAAKPIAGPDAGPAAGAVARPEEQDPPDDAPDPGVATLHVTAGEVDVDVMVTDAQGQPVHGLQQSDFSVEENGKPQSIRSFREFTAADPVPEPPSVKLPPGVYTNSQALPASGPVNIFLLDALNSGFNVFEAKRQILTYLRTMSPGIHIAIFWLSETGLHTLQPFTSDREALLRAMETNRLDFGAVGNRWTIQKTTAQALNQIAVYVSGIKGRKNLFWFAPGMPVDLMRDGGYGWGNPDMSMVHRLMDTYELLTAAQVAVYPVDPRGIVGLRRAQLKVEQVAEDFGTDAVFNTNDLTAGLGKLIANGSEFYTLSYIPPNQKYDGHYHHIKVTLDRPGLKLSYRKGYNAERLPTVDHPSPGPALMKASMEGNAPAATQLLFDVGVWPGNQPAAAPPVKLPGKKQPKPPPPTVHYEIHYGFPASQIAFAEQPDGTLHGAVEFDVVAYDINRTRVALLTQIVNMPLSVGQYDDFAAVPFRFTQQIDLPPGQISLHVGMIDKTSNKVGTLEIPLNVIYDPQRTAPVFRAPYVPCPPRCPIPSAP